CGVSTFRGRLASWVKGGVTASHPYSSHTRLIEKGRGESRRSVMPAKAVIHDFQLQSDKSRGYPGSAFGRPGMTQLKHRREEIQRCAAHHARSARLAPLAPARHHGENCGTGGPLDESAPKDHL